MIGKVISHYRILEKSRQKDGGQVREGGMGAGLSPEAYLLPFTTPIGRVLPSRIAAKRLLQAFVLLFMAVNFQPLTAQEKLLPVFQFNRLTTADGFPTNEIRSNVVRDRMGFIWVGTVSGLVRYDGYACKVYPEFRGPNDALVLLIDTKGRLWIGTYASGLSLYDPMHDRFISFLPRQGDSSSIQLGNIISIHEDKSGIIWLAGTPHLVRLDLHDARDEANADSVAAHARFQNIAYAGFGERVSQVDAWDDARVLLASNRGLFIIDHETCGISRPDLPRLPGLNLDTVAIRSLFWETPQKLWIGTLLHGLCLFDRASRSITAYHKSPATPHRTRDDHIQSLQKDRSGRLWIATNEAVDLFDVSSGVYRDYIASSRAPGKSLWTRMSIDSTGILWISTADDGLYFLPPASLRFPRYALKGSSGGPMEMETIDRWSDGSYWIGAEGNVARIAMDSLTVIETVDLFKGKKSGYGRSGVWASYDDGKGTLWYGTWGLGLYRFEPNTGRVTNFRSTAQLPGLLVKEDVARSIIGVGGDSLWIAAYNDGILSFDTRGEKYAEVPHAREGSPGYLMKDRTGNIWVSDEFRGLFVVDPSTGRWEHFQHDPNDPGSISRSHPQCTYQDPQGRIWVGCDTLDLWKPETRSFKHFPNSAFNKALYATPVGSDGRGRVWIRYLGGGLGILDPAAEHFTNFDYSDGAVGALGMSSLQDGKVLLVGHDGMNIVDPDSVFKSQAPPPLVFTKVSTNDTTSLPLQRISAATGLRLRYDENVLEIGFAAIDPGATHLIDYQYRLEGLEKSWLQSNGRRFVRYPGLNPGDYVFRVRAVNKFARWPDQEITLAVSISPPWWRTWWAYGGYGFLIISVLYWGYRVRLRQVRLKQLAEMEHFQSEHLAEVDRLKSRFFSNISHEFRTPLTLILGPARQILERSGEEETKTKADLIHRSARKLNRLVDELLDIAKIEAGEMKLNARPVNVVPVVHDIVLTFQSLAERKKIACRFSCDEHKIVAYLDKEKADKIVTNVLSNAFKFTPEGGKVEVGVNVHPSDEGGAVTITIADTGIGIPKDQKDKIFDRFYQVDGTHTREQEGTGIGLALTKELVELHRGRIEVESEEGKGSTFRLIFPLGKAHLKPEEIGSEEKEDEEEGTIPELDETVVKADNQEIGAEVLVSSGLPSLLIVEDNPDVRTYISSILENKYRILEATNGEEGLRKSLECIPDLIITDIMMPKMDGFQLCGILKSDPRTSHIPLIMLTAKATSNDKINGLQSGADDYIMKPFEAHELEARLENLIAQRKRLHEHFRTYGLMEMSEKNVTSVDQKFLRKGLEVINEHISDASFSVEVFAEEMAVSRSLLVRKLESLLGEPPSELIRRTRLNRAAKLIARKAGNISEIALEVGFSNPSYFAECFRKQFGCTPTQYFHNSSKLPSGPPSK